MTNNALSITPNEYQELAMRTCSVGNRDERLPHAVFGLCSEAGEVSGLFQKLYQGHELDRDHIVKELGDALWFIAEALDAIDVTMEDCMAANIEKLRKRYPEGFDAERSLNREEGDI